MNFFFHQYIQNFCQFYQFYSFNIYSLFVLLFMSHLLLSFFSFGKFIWEQFKAFSLLSFFFDSRSKISANLIQCWKFIKLFYVRIILHIISMDNFVIGWLLISLLSICLFFPDFNQRHYFFRKGLTFFPEGLTFSGKFWFQKKFLERVFPECPGYKVQSPNVIVLS